MYQGSADGDLCGALAQQKRTLSVDDSRHAGRILCQIHVFCSESMDPAGNDSSCPGDGRCVRVSDDTFYGAGDPGSLTCLRRERKRIDGQYPAKYTNIGICITGMTIEKKCIGSNDSKKGLNMEAFNSFFYTLF